QLGEGMEHSDNCAGLVGLFLPFLFHTSIGHLFLPVDQSIQGTTQEDHFVRNVFVACGFASVFIPALATSLFLVRDRSSSFWASILCAGLAIGAAVQMIWLSPGGWSFIMR
ncbi:hypothetical protein ACFLS1_05450, partial [Verrucomicrobiota bacterium]